MDPADYSGADYIRFICGTCEDFRVVAGPENVAGSVPCPNCGTDEQRRELFTRNKTMPEIRVSDLTGEEQELFRDWRVRGHHELDCLRWIEGRRYDPAKDPEFMADCTKRLDEWRADRDKRFTEARPLPPLHSCVKCGTACDDQTIFCPPCWKKWQDAHP